MRAIAIAVLIVTIPAWFIVDSVGRLFINNQFHASELFLGTAIGALLLLLGVEAVNRLPGVPKGG